MNVLVIYGHQQGWNVHPDKLLKHLTPFFIDVKYYTEILSLKNYLEYNNNKNYILPLTEPHILELNEHQIKAIMTTPEVISIFSNKDVFDKYIVQHNLTSYAPKRYYFNDNSNKLVIVKPPCGGSSVGMYLSNINNLDSSVFDNHVVQEYIKADTEFTGNLVVQDGNILYGFAYYRYYGDRNYIKHDSQDFTVQKKVPISKKYLDVLELFLKPVNYTGICNVDFKLVNDEIIVFEINPRCGGSLFFSQHYSDFAYIICQLMNVKY
jgi:predicted ATP-grasp superfamily ATP-dependent carboligase